MRNAFQANRILSGKKNGWKCKNDISVKYKVPAIICGESHVNPDPGALLDVVGLDGDCCLPIARQQGRLRSGRSLTPPPASDLCS